MTTKTNQAINDAIRARARRGTPLFPILEKATARLAPARVGEPHDAQKRTGIGHNTTRAYACGCLRAVSGVGQRAFAGVRACIAVWFLL